MSSPTAAVLPAAYRQRPLPRWGRQTMAAAWWAHRALRSTRGRLAVDGVRTVVPPPPPLSPGATRGVLGVLRRQPTTCLERTLVLQRWLASCGEPYEVILGVATTERFVAHAWLPFEEGARTRPFAELTRIPPPAP
jgi:hypothetical protein